MTALPPDHVGWLPSSALTRQLAHTRARMFHRSLDAALAAGQPPWDAGDLMVRAAELCARSTRAQLASSLDALVLIAEARPFSQLVRSRTVLSHRAPLLALAERLRELAPVEVAVVARVATLTWDRASPAYHGGASEGEFDRVIGRCLHVLQDAH